MDGRGRSAESMERSKVEYVNDRQRRGDAASMSSSSGSAVEIRVIDARKGKGVFATRPIRAGEALVTTAPLLLYHPTGSILPTCGAPSCHRVLAPLERLVALHQACARQASERESNSNASTSPTSTSTSTCAVGPVATLPSFSQELLPYAIPCSRSRAASPSNHDGNDNADDAHPPCAEVYCSEACRDSAWAHYHRLLCVDRRIEDERVCVSDDDGDDDDDASLSSSSSSSSATTLEAFLARRSALRRFFAHRNVARNADAQMAARALAFFVQSCQSMMLASSTSHENADHVRDVCSRAWLPLACFHAVPWSRVVPFQSLCEQLPYAECVRVLNDVRQPQSVREYSSHATPILLQQESQYRAAIADAYADFAASLPPGPWLPSSGSGASRIGEDDDTACSVVSFAAFDRLCGANRLNCTMTETALPLAASDFGTAGAAGAAARCDTTLSNVTVIDKLARAFDPFPVPIATARALCPLHASFNHSCAPNAVVTNAQDAIISRLRARARPSASQTVPTAHTASSTVPTPSSRLIICATRDIAEGEEVCISYVPASSLASSSLPVPQEAARQRHLKLLSNYQFVCECAECLRVVSALAESTDGATASGSSGGKAKSASGACGQRSTSAKATKVTATASKR